MKLHVLLRWLIVPISAPLTSNYRFAGKSKQMRLELSSPLIYIVRLLLAATPVLAIAPSADALPSAHTGLSNTTDTPSLIRKIATYDRGETRQSLDQYARSHYDEPSAVQEKLSATGKLQCGNHVATANLTISSSVITTAHHVLCHGPLADSSVKECRFAYTYQARAYVVSVAGLVKTGGACAFASGMANLQDWAVLRLASPAVGPTPYDVDLVRGHKVFGGHLVTAVEALSVDFCERDRSGHCVRDGKGMLWRLPKSAQDCTIVHADGHFEGEIYFSNLYATDCAASDGASGGAILDGNLGAVPTLLGLIVGSGGSSSDFEKERKTGTPVNRPFSLSPPFHVTAAVPINEDILSAVKEAASADRKENGRP